MAADPRERRREGSRRAQAARSKREEARKKKKNRQLMFGGGAIVAVVAAIASLLLFTGGVDGPGQVVDTQDGWHYTTQEQFDAWEYNTSPPSSGPHWGHMVPYGFLGQTVRPEEVLHSSEHGAVIIWYQPDDPALAAQVRDIVDDYQGRCLVAGAYPDMDAHVAATAWGRIQTWDAFNREDLAEFIEAYRGRLGGVGEEGLCWQQS